MKGPNLKFWLGSLFLLTGTALVLVAVVYPYSKLWGKSKISFEKPTVEGDWHPTVLPVFAGLRSRPEGSSSRFFLTIEKLGITKVPLRLDIFVNNTRPEYLNELLTSLAHLKGSVYPGEKGNSLIFGHSALPYLYSPRNFQTIFTKIDELKFGDLIMVETESKVFRYRVEKGGLVDDRAELSDFASRKARLTLLTCYPPGFRSFRYAVSALAVD